MPREAQAQAQIQAHATSCEICLQLFYSGRELKLHYHIAISREGRVERLHLARRMSPWYLKMERRRYAPQPAIIQAVGNGTIRQLSTNSTITVPFFSPATSIVSLRDSSKFLPIDTSSNSAPSFPSSGSALRNS
jgi:hypothetical protein